MPAAVHDDFVSLQHPLQRILDGQWDIFSDYQQRYTPYYSFTTPSDPPGYYYLAALPRYIANQLSPDLPQWMDHCWSIYQNTDPALTRLDYFLDAGTYHVFRNLFLIKWHYLFLDVMIGFLLLGLVPDSKQKIWVFALWMLNPFTLHSTFAHGHYDIMPTACCVAALVLLQSRHRGPGMLLLSAGFMIKVFPALFIPPLILLLSRDLKDAVKLALWAAIPFLVFLLPLGIATGGEALQFLRHYEIDRRMHEAGMIQQLQKVFFIAAYLGLLAYSFRSRKSYLSDIPGFTGRIFIVTLLILFSSTQIEFRYFIWLTPLILPLVVQDRNIRWVFILQAVSITILRIVPQKSLQIPIFSPLYPEYFLSLVSWNTYISQVMDPTLLYQLAYRLFLLASLLLLILVWKPGVLEKIDLKVIRVPSAMVAASMIAITTGLILAGYLRYPGPTEPRRINIWEKVNLTGQTAPANGSLRRACFTPRSNNLNRLSCLVASENISKNDITRKQARTDNPLLFFPEIQPDRHAAPDSTFSFAEPIADSRDRKFYLNVQGAIPDREYYVLAEYQISENVAGHIAARFASDVPFTMTIVTLSGSLLLFSLPLPWLPL